MIKAIETRYKGYRFRSRLEARWSVLFDALGIEWEYEKEGYDLGCWGYYLPDFEIKTTKGNRWFVEVKGDMTDETGLAKARYLDNFHPGNFMGCLIVCDLDYAKCITDKDGPCFNKAFLIYQRLSLEGGNITIEDYNRAVNKARSSRFEHGEKGG